MYFKKISLENFRNYKKQVVCFHPKVNIITGKNAQGKTNLLESLYIMSLGKSFRTNKDTDMIGFEEEFCNAKATYSKEGRESNIEITISKEGKSIKLDSVRAQKNSELLDNIYSVIFSPEDLKIVKEEPEKRRKFIDRELCQLKPVYYKNLVRYKKILLQRNTLLKQGKNDEAMLDVWDKSLVEYGSKIIFERRDFIEKLNRLSRELHRKITNDKEELELFYEANVPAQDNLQELGSIFLDKLSKGRKADLYRGSTGTGPHKDDLKICINGIDIRHFGSQGQQRTAALSLKLAEIHLIKEEKGEDAILLLDDVLSELDQDRQRFLIESLSEVQLFITTTELGDFLLTNMPTGDVFIVSQGQVEKVQKKFDKKAL
jgi:DNA replication and repair protein RecF